MNRRLLEALFGSELRARVLQFFYERPWAKFHQREVERELNRPFGSLNRLLRSYAEAGLLTRAEDRKVVLYQTPPDDVRLRPLVELFRQETKLVGHLHKAVKPFMLAYAGIFGSYARGEETAESDVDLLAIRPDDAPDCRMQLVGAVARVAFATNREINVDLYTVSEFRKLIHEDNSFALNVLGSPRIDLKGKIDAEAEAGPKRRSRSKLSQESVQSPTSGEAAR
jgi:predicted nucleotidyltransferase